MARLRGRGASPIWNHGTVKIPISWKIRAGHRDRVAENAAVASKSCQVDDASRRADRRFGNPEIQVALLDGLHFGQIFFRKIPGSFFLMLAADTIRGLPETSVLGNVEHTTRRVKQ
jgi:hypothetical protein